MIMLNDIRRIENPHDYKVHFVRHNRHVHPLDVPARGAGEWKEWQEYRPKRNEFNRDFIFSLARFHHETDTRRFGGIFQVIGRLPRRYEVELNGRYRTDA